MQKCNAPYLLVAFIAAVLLLPGVARGQGVGSLIPKSNRPAETPREVDPLKRDTPREAIYQLLESCHAGKDEISAQFLDLTHIRRDLRAVQGPELAKNLCEILDRDTRFAVGRLSNNAEGNLADALGPNVDRLAQFDLNGQIITLTLQRSTLGNLQPWLVSPDSVSQIPKLVTLNAESPIEQKLPAVLVTTKFVGTSLYIWLVLIIAAIILMLLSRLLSRLFLMVLRPVARRFGKKLHEHRLESLAEPLRLIIAVIVFSAIIHSTAASAILRDYLFKVLILLFIIGCTSLAMRVVDLISDTLVSRMNSRERALSYSVFPLFVRVIKVIVLAIGILWVLSSWGYNTNAILAGLGVGGLAVALAAQKTIENFFGGVSVITDRPVLVGDFCKFGDQAGTVEDIGLRSTRIRTNDRSVVTIPNSVFSTMTLENFAKRDRMWFHPTISLNRETESTKITAMMDAITKILEEHAMVDPTTVPLRFTKITRESFDLEIYAYVLTPSFDEFLKVQTELLLKIIGVAQQLRVNFAMPLQETILGPALTKTLTSKPAESAEPETSA